MHFQDPFLFELKKEGDQKKFKHSYMKRQQRFTLLRWITCTMSSFMVETLTSAWSGWENSSKMFPVATQSAVPWSCDLRRRCHHWSSKDRSSSTVASTIESDRCQKFPGLSVLLPEICPELCRDCYTAATSSVIELRPSIDTRRTVSMLGQMLGLSRAHRRSERHSTAVESPESTLYLDQ